MRIIKAGTNDHPDDPHQPSKEPHNPYLSDYLYHGSVSFHRKIGHRLSMIQQAACLTCGCSDVSTEQFSGQGFNELVFRIDIASL
jgi:hypothetical protein